MPLVIPPSSSDPPQTLTYLHAYQSILKRCRESEEKSASKVVIFAGVDVDALLASQILVDLFKQDDIPHTLIPITGYAELEKRREQLFGPRIESEDQEGGSVNGDDRDRGEGSSKGRDQVQTLILLSLGSLLPLSSYFSVEDSSCHIHLIDAHRPYNLDNLFGPAVNDGFGSGLEQFDVRSNGARNKGWMHLARRDEQNGDARNPNTAARIWVWGDGDEGRLEKIRISYEALEYEPPSDSEDDSDADSDGRETDGEDSENETESEGSDHGADGDSNGERRRKRGQERSAGKRSRKKKRKDPDEKSGRLSRDERNGHTARIQKYYHAGTSYGLSVAESCYLLASELERGDNDLLWCAILGLTHQYITSRIDRDEYEDRHANYADEVARLNPGSSSRSSKGSSPPIKADDYSISLSEELRFVLFRHWNLYDAMLHSGYVAGRMGIWKDRGRKRLMGLLAKMGFSIAQCRQSYNNMDIKLKATLRDKLDAIAPEYGLVELTYPSFTRAAGYRLSALSAADAVEGIEALLQAAIGVKIEVEADGSKGGGEWFGGTHSWSLPSNLVRGLDCNGRLKATALKDDNVRDQLDDPTQSIQLEQLRSEVNFWVAYDALNDISLTRKSLSLARALHAAIIRQGCSILDKRSIKTLRAFRFATIREGPDMKLFCNPSALERLAKWLVDATRDGLQRKLDLKSKSKREDSQSHPIVLACLNEERQTYTIVGITGAPEFGDTRKNHFGLAFQAAAEESGAGARHDMFDTSVVEVNQEDLITFIEHLQLQSS